MNRTGLLLIVSGPAGSGKTTVCERLLGELPELQRIVTATTRAPRGNEVNGSDYHFLAREDFEARIAAGAFYEYAQVHHQLYGTLKSEVQAKLRAGIDLLLNIDVQGAAQMRATAATDALLNGRIASVFILPPTLEELERRLRGRGTDSDDEIQRRMQVALEEMEHADRYDHVLRSSSKEADFEALRSIYQAEMQRVR
ncbi:MAG: guanylate kinase [Opitutales bacterium]